MNADARLYNAQVYHTCAKWIEILSLMLLMKVAKCGNLLAAWGTAGGNSATKASEPHFPAPTNRGGQGAPN